MFRHEGREDGHEAHEEILFTTENTEDTEAVMAAAGGVHADKTFRPYSKRVCAST
jgi:hypothetical protein